MNCLGAGLPILSLRRRIHVARMVCAVLAMAALLAPPAAAAGQPAACGGPGQRACCFGERLTACDAGTAPVALGQFRNACSGFGADTCVPLSPPTACGGEGQRACCGNEGPACQGDLVNFSVTAATDPFVAVGGDATCRNQAINGSTVPRSAGTCISPAPPVIAEPTAGWSPTPEPRGVLRGYLDMHLHLLGNMAHGGRNLAGLPAPVGPDGRYVLDASNNVNSALSGVLDLQVHSNPLHGLLFDISGAGTGDGTRAPFGAPYFNGWPQWNSTTHQQTYYVWLERAWRGGLRATTLFASHVESLCKTSLKSTREDSWPICEDSMRHIVNQLRAARDFERFVDDISGGPGLGWFRIVTTPAQARAVVRTGKLAVVLGIEVDNLFNCKEAGCPADFGLSAERIAPLTSLPQPTTLAEAVNVIYDMGVRHVFPIHNFDNGFGAAATWMDAIGVGQAIAEQRWWVTRDCGDGRGDYGYWIDNFIQLLMSVLGFGIGDTPPVPPYTNGNLSPAYASCNAYGLRAMGVELLQLLMAKGMLIDIDHMSAYSLEQTIDVTAAGLNGSGPAYPLLASHVQAFDLHRKEFADNKGRHERMRTRAQLDAIRASGGLVAAMLKDDVVDTDLKGWKVNVPYAPQWGAPVADNCRHSSKTFAQAVQYAVDVMGGPVALGSDFNGAAGHIGPRFGSDACGGWGIPNGSERPLQVLENNAVAYPFTLPGFGSFDRQVTGFRAFDFNVDGLAHVGLLPDLMADLERVGLDARYTDEVFCSAEAYIRVWERAEALAGGLPPPDPNRPWLCRLADGTPPVSTVSLSPAASAAGWHNTGVTATITATDADSGVERIDYSTTVSGATTSGAASGASATTTMSGEGETGLSFFATDLAGNVESPNTVAVRIDRTPPSISVSRSPVANAAGWNNTPVTATFQCTDALSGVASCAAPHVFGTDGASQAASGDATDVAGNMASASIADVHIDRVTPIVTVTGVADGAIYALGSVPPAGCSTTDALSGVATPATASVAGGTSNGVGQFTATCGGAVDRAGNTGTSSATYTVRYVFDGFKPPVNNLPVVNDVKAGQTVPVKFGLGGDHGLDVLQGATSVLVSCSAGSVLDPIEQVVLNPGASQFTFDPASRLYQFNWKTERSWANSCRRLLVRLDDGSLHTAEFRLR